MSNSAKNTGHQKVRDTLKADVDEYIGGLFDIERVVIGILGSATSPISTNEIRSRFIEDMYANLRQNVRLVSFFADYKNPEVKAACKDFQKFLDSMYKESIIKKTEFLMKDYDELIKSGKINKTSKIKLIPSFKYFRDVLGELSKQGIVSFRSSPYGQTKEAYFLEGKFHKNWVENRTTLNKEIFQRGHAAAHISKVNFYYLTPFELDRIINLVSEQKPVESGAINLLLGLTDSETKYLETKLLL